MVKRYKTKPCEIKAVQWTGDNKKEVFEFCNECEIRQRVRRTQKGRIEADYSIEEYLVIPTLEGDMEASIQMYQPPHNNEWINLHMYLPNTL